MFDWNRRSFLKAGGALALTGLVADPVRVAAANPSPSAGADTAVRFMGDGISLSPVEYAELLAQIATGADFRRDVYATGGVVAELEEKFARLLGKETAVFLPTGTMANHIALRRLTGSGKRVIVQAKSHLYNDSGDCAQKLSGLNLVPVADSFDPDSIGAALRQAQSGRVKTPVGAISLESPLRRGFNSTHPSPQAGEIAAFARSEGLGLHLDGARLFMQAAHQGFDPAAYAAPFDTVYVSLYKNFNAAGGAVLAGPQALLEDLLHERRMFGGSPCHVWPLAAPALFFADEFVAGYRRARRVCDRLRDLLADDGRFRFRSVPEGSNGFWLSVDGLDAARFVENLKKRNVHVLPPREGWDGLLLMINPTLGRRPAEELAQDFRSAVGE